MNLQEWGLEGYHLWMIGTQSAEEESSQYESVDQSHLIQLQFVKSSLTVNPCMVSPEIMVFMVFFWRGEHDRGNIEGKETERAEKMKITTTDV